MSSVLRPGRLLDPGSCLSLRPLKYPVFYDMYRNAVRNTRPTTTMAVSATSRCASAFDAGPGTAGPVNAGGIAGGAVRSDP